MCTLVQRKEMHLRSITADKSHYLVEGVSIKYCIFEQTNIRLNHSFQIKPLLKKWFALRCGARTGEGKGLFFLNFSGGVVVGATSTPLGDS